MTYFHVRRSTRLGPIGAAVLAVLVTGGAAIAQEHVVRSMDILRDQLGVDKRQVIDANLVLTQAQAESFWPIYDEYQEELDRLHERFARVVHEYAVEYDSGSITNARAVELLDEAIAIDEDEVDLRKRTAQRLKRVIPGIEAARYLQIENKIQAIVRFELAEEIPLVE